MATRFAVSKNYCTMPHEQELIEVGPHFKASFGYGGRGKSTAEGKRGLHLYLRKYVACTVWGFSKDAFIYGAGFWLKHHKGGRPLCLF